MHPSLWRIGAYVLAGIPAAIGVAFVARYAYVTSDTVIDGVSNAFLFGMVAAGAFAGPACAVAVHHNGRKAAGAVLGLLAVLAILTNWSHTLGAIASRGAGTEAQTAKDARAEADARSEIARLETSLAGLVFTAATAETVSAARAAVTAAERSRIAECGAKDDPKHRGVNCRDREVAEREARSALTLAEQNRAATDRAAELETKAAAIRAKLATKPATKSTNSLGEALERILPLSAMTATTVQQGLVSAIVELLIAATLTLPELLRKDRAPSARCEDMPADAQSITEIDVSVGPIVQPADTVGRFMLACVTKAPDEEVTARAIYEAYGRWCAGQSPLMTALGVAPFAEQFAARCKRHAIRTRRDSSAIVCLGIKLNSALGRQRLGRMARCSA